MTSKRKVRETTLMAQDERVRERIVSQEEFNNEIADDAAQSCVDWSDLERRKGALRYIVKQIWESALLSAPAPAPAPASSEVQVPATGMNQVSTNQPATSVEGPASPVKALVEKWRKDMEAHADCEGYEGGNHGDWQNRGIFETLKWCADELESALQAAPETSASGLSEGQAERHNALRKVIEEVRQLTLKSWPRTHSNPPDVEEWRTVIAALMRCDRDFADALLAIAPSSGPPASAEPVEALIAAGQAMRQGYDALYADIHANDMNPTDPSSVTAWDAALAAHLFSTPAPCLICGCTPCSGGLNCGTPAPAERPPEGIQHPDWGYDPHGNWICKTPAPTSVEGPVSQSVAALIAKWLDWEQGNKGTAAARYAVGSCARLLEFTLQAEQARPAHVCDDSYGYRIDGVPTCGECGKALAKSAGQPEEGGVISKLEVKCANCGHARIEHVDFSGPCDSVKWIGGHPEYRCMCHKFIKAKEDK
jgi:hypothetical protein